MVGFVIDVELRGDPVQTRRGGVLKLQQQRLFQITRPSLDHHQASLDSYAQTEAANLGVAEGVDGRAQSYLAGHNKLMCSS